MSTADPRPRSSAPATAREQRDAFLATSAASADIRPTKQFPRVFGVVVDWRLGLRHVVSVAALCDGSAKLLARGGSVIAAAGDEELRQAARTLVASADWHYAEGVPTTDFRYPGRGRVRFYLMTYDGVRCIESERAAATATQGRYKDLFDLARRIAAVLLRER
jgi:hypothetical protein